MYFKLVIFCMDGYGDFFFFLKTYRQFQEIQRGTSTQRLRPLQKQSAGAEEDFFFLSISFDILNIKSSIYFMEVYTPNSYITSSLWSEKRGLMLRRG